MSLGKGGLFYVFYLTFNVTGVSSLEQVHPSGPGPVILLRAMKIFKFLLEPEENQQSLLGGRKSLNI